MANNLITEGKFIPVGIKERVRIINTYYPEIIEQYVYDKAKLFKCNPDDIVDSIILCIVANLAYQGKTEYIPDNPMKDSTGILMRLVVPSKNAPCGTWQNVYTTPFPSIS